MGWYFLLTSRCTDKRVFARMSLGVWGALRLRLKGWVSPSPYLKRTGTHRAMSTAWKQNSKSQKIKTCFDTHFRAVSCPFLSLNKQVLIMPSCCFVKHVIRSNKCNSEWQKQESCCLRVFRYFKMSPCCSYAHPHGWVRKVNWALPTLFY